MDKLEEHFRNNQICSLPKPQDRHLENHPYLLRYPAYSPDLTPHDFFVFNYMKSKVYLNPRPQNPDQLWEKCQQVWADIPDEMFFKVSREYHIRARKCLAVQGRHFEREKLDLDFDDEIEEWKTVLKLIFQVQNFKWIIVASLMYSDFIDILEQSILILLLIQDYFHYIF